MAILSNFAIEVLGLTPEVIDTIHPNDYQLIERQAEGDPYWDLADLSIDSLLSHIKREGSELEAEVSNHYQLTTRGQLTLF